MRQDRHPQEIVLRPFRKAHVRHHGATDDSGLVFGRRVYDRVVERPRRYLDITGHRIDLFRGGFFRKAKDKVKVISRVNEASDAR
jgi:hypothetical protein